MKLREKLPHEFFMEHVDDSSAARYLDIDVVSTYDTSEVSWPGKHKNVHVWWELENGKAVGWNENPSKGWSFPVIKMRSRDDGF